MEEKREKEKEMEEEAGDGRKEKEMEKEEVRDEWKERGVGDEGGSWRWKEGELRKGR